jgi:uncharacterized Zn finger protein
MSWYYGWKPYVSVAQRRHNAQNKMDALRKKGAVIQPVVIEGRQITQSFWGDAWCEHLESFSDFANRLPRGRSYVRNGSVCHLEIAKGKIEAKVSGSELYTVGIAVKSLPAKKWSDLKRRCTGKIGSLIELLGGDLSDQVMELVADRKNGLFPLPGEISLECSCPDWADMCKHVAAVLYGVGARLDTKPELLFKLRGVDHEELIAADAQAAVKAATRSGKSKRLASHELAGVFGIELVDAPRQPTRLEVAADAKTAPRKTAKRVGKPAKAATTAERQTAPATKKTRKRQVA